MIVTELQKRIPAIPCPLCGNLQDVIVNGYTKDGDDNRVDNDRGYAFCNCRNIFFTKFNDNAADIYDQAYTSKYNAENAKKFVKNYKCYIPSISEIKTFLEIGAASDAVLDEAALQGWNPIGLDIANRESKYNFIHTNFEDPKFVGIKYNGYIFASHVFEHFKDPIGMVKKCHGMLSEGGLLFVAMPDPWFIDFQNAYQWGHWHLEEHHIMWDMDSFCKVLEENGFEVMVKEHNTDYKFICTNDFHILARKK